MTMADPISPKNGGTTGIHQPLKRTKYVVPHKVPAARKELTPFCQESDRVAQGSADRIFPVYRHFHVKVAPTPDQSKIHNHSSASDQVLMPGRPSSAALIIWLIKLA